MSAAGCLLLLLLDTAAAEALLLLHAALLLLLHHPLLLLVHALLLHLHLHLLLLLLLIDLSLPLLLLIHLLLILACLAVSRGHLLEEPSHGATFDLVDDGAIQLRICSCQVLQILEYIYELICTGLIASLLSKATHALLLELLVP